MSIGHMGQIWFGYFFGSCSLTFSLDMRATCCSLLCYVLATLHLGDEGMTGMTAAPAVL